MGGVQFFKVSRYRMLRPTCIQKLIEKPSILRSELGQNRRKFAFSFRVRFEVDFSSIFGGSGVQSGVPRRLQVGSEKCKKDVKKGVGIKPRFGSVLGSILGRFWVHFGSILGSILGRFWGRF